MAAITLESPQGRIAREDMLSRRLMRWAIAGSVAAHLVAFAIISAVHLAPLPLPHQPRLIEVKLVHTGPPVASPQVSAQPHAQPAALARPEHAIRQSQPTTHLPVKSSSAAPAPTRRTAAQPPLGGIVGSPPHSPVEPRRVAAPSPGPTPGSGQPPELTPAPGPATSPGGGGGAPAGAGGDIGLGSGSRQGDIPGGGSGSGSGSGTGGGSGAGAGSGSGSGGGPGSGAGTGGAGGSGSHVSRLADRKLPALVRRVNPVYPVAAQVEGVQGTVRLLVTVTREGTVGAVKVASSSGDSRLDAAAVAAVKQWRYHPAVQDGIPREVSTHAVVTFSLE